MSLPRQDCPENQASAVVRLNVGGHLFSTCLSTLSRYPESRLSQMFSQPLHLLHTDSEGRYFIDRDGTHFGAVLDFLRSEQLPSHSIRQVYQEAVYYNIRALAQRLEDSPPMFGELVGRQQFLSRVPHYKENIEVLIRVGRAEALAARRSSVLVCVLQSEEDLQAVASLGADTQSVVTFGPWKAASGVKDLLDCIQMDIESQGYSISIHPHNHDKGFLSRSHDYFYKLIFTWW